MKLFLLVIYLVVITTPVLASDPNYHRTTAFSDVPQTHWAYQAVEFLRGKGILEGWDDGRMHGKSTFTRYEMAVIVARFLSRIEKALENLNLSEGEKALLGTLYEEFHTEMSALKLQNDRIEIELKKLNKTLIQTKESTRTSNRKTVLLSKNYEDIKDRLEAIEDSLQSTPGSLPFPLPGPDVTNPLVRRKDVWNFVRRCINDAERAQKIIAAQRAKQHVRNR